MFWSFRYGIIKLSNLYESIVRYAKQPYETRALQFLFGSSSSLRKIYFKIRRRLVYQPSFHDLISQRSFENQIPVARYFLPFINVSSDAENEYFCDGLAEELINSFYELDKLRVAARTVYFKGKREPMFDISGVERSKRWKCRKSGNRLRITAQLINVADGYRKQSERWFDQHLEDISKFRKKLRWR